MIERQPSATSLLRAARALLCVSVDPWHAPQGGQTSFARHLLTAFRGELAVVATSTPETPEGEWSVREFRGSHIAFFSLGALKRHGERKPLIPARISVYRMAARHMARVHASGVPNIFLDDPELLLAAAKYPWASSCYNVAGVFNPAQLSRYPFGRFFSRLCEKAIARALVRLDPEVILAAGDASLVERMRRVPGLAERRIESLPTRVDLEKFYPEPAEGARQALGLPPDALVLAAIGRLCWIKGWDLLLRALAALKAERPNVLLVFVGDGEDRPRLLADAQALGVSGNIRITGFVPPSTVRQHLNAADVCVVGSYSEGWSVAMLEALACGKPMVSTAVSGSRDMISEGRNGFVVPARHPREFAAAVTRAIQLPRAARVSREIAARYAVDTLGDDLRERWSVLREQPVLAIESRRSGRI
jgi:glycosyltransferase involved in cell wall biosynthesis